VAIQHFTTKQDSGLPRFARNDGLINISALPWQEKSYLKSIAGFNRNLMYNAQQFITLRQPISVAVSYPDYVPYLKIPKITTHA
jgi:hypothetical protein